MSLLSHRSLQIKLEPKATCINFFDIVMLLLPFRWSAYKFIIWHVRKGNKCHSCQRGCLSFSVYLNLPLLSDPGMHHGTCVAHVPWCMSGSLIHSGGENVSGIPGACTTRNFMYWHSGGANQSKHHTTDIPRLPLFYDLTLNNGKWVILPIWWW